MELLFFLYEKQVSEGISFSIKIAHPFYCTNRYKVGYKGLSTESTSLKYPPTPTLILFFYIYDLAHVTCRASQGACRLASPHHIAGKTSKWCHLSRFKLLPRAHFLFTLINHLESELKGDLQDSIWLMGSLRPLNGD